MKNPPHPRLLIKDELDELGLKGWRAAGFVLEVLYQGPAARLERQKRPGSIAAAFPGHCGADWLDRDAHQHPTVEGRVSGRLGPHGRDLGHNIDHAALGHPQIPCLLHPQP
jgi:hypothetical protein